MSKKTIVLSLIFVMLMSSVTYAIKYSENGYIDGEAIQSVEKTLFLQDFENTGIKVGANVDQAIAWKTQSATTPKIQNDPVLGKNNICLEVGRGDSTNTTSAAHIYTPFTTSGDKATGFVDGTTYTLSLDVYLKPVSTDVTERDCELWWSKGSGTKGNNPATIDKTLPTFTWTTISLTYTYHADDFRETVDNTVSNITTRLRFQVIGCDANDVFYLDNAKWTYADEIKEKVEVPWISYEDFESNPKFSTTNTSDMIVGIGGASAAKPTTGIMEFENAHSGKYVAGLKGKSTGWNSNNSKIIAGSSYRLKFYNLFHLSNRTPILEGGTWTQGWEMFTEEDIGKEFEISVWVYADSTGGAYPYGDTQAAIDGYISGDEIDVNNQATLPSLSVGLNGPGSSAENDSQSYKYGANPISMVQKKLNWNEWTEYKLHYVVSADTIYVVDSKGENTLINAIGVNSTGGSDYYPCNFYVDDITVKELTVQPRFSLVSENEVMVDVYVPNSLTAEAQNPMVLAGVFDSDTQELISARVLDDLSRDTLTAQLDVDFTKNMKLKLFLWDKETLVPITNRVIWEIPGLNEFKNDITIDRIAQSFHGDVYTQKGFNWYTTNLYTSEICYVEKTADTPDWTNAAYLKANASVERHYDFMNDSSVRQKVVVQNLKPGTAYYYRVGNKEFNLWSDTYTMETADNTTNNAEFYLLADPQSSTYSAAAPKGKMLSHIFEAHPNGEFILSAGDLVIDYTKEQQWIDTFEANSFTTPNITFNGAAGDHDTDCLNTNIEQAYGKHFNYPVPEGASKGKLYYSFDYKDMHIAVIDTTMLPYDAENDKEQMDWLRADMRATDKKWKIVITHECPQTATVISSTDYGASYRRKASLMPVFSDLGVDLVLGGDAHLYSRTYPIKGVGADGEGNMVGNPNPTIVKTETIDGRTTKFFDTREGVTYVTLGSVSDSTGKYEADGLNSEIALIPTYDVVLAETGCTAEDLENISTYTVAKLVGDDLILSVYHYDFNNPEAGGTLFDQFAITKTAE